MPAMRIQSRIDAVTVYREGARVRRISEISADSGHYPERVCVTGLPLAMQDASVRIRVEPDNSAGSSDAGPGSDAAALPVAADVRVTLDIPDPDESLRPPVDEELEAARTAVRHLTGRVAQLKRELSRLDRLVIASRPRGSAGEEVQPPPASPTDARLALLSLREQRERGLRDELARLDDELRDAEREARRLETRHHRASTARQVNKHELRKALVVSLHANGAVATRARLVIEYMVPGARWAPAYTIRLRPGDAASFSMRAVVAQQTGEDWRGAALTLSTADAHAWSDLPELTSMRIGRRQARPARTGWRPPPTGAGELFADYDRELGARAPSRMNAPEQVSQWDDETREITTPARRAPGAPVFNRAPTDNLDFDEVTGQYATPPKEIDAFGGPPPPPSMSAPVPMSMPPSAAPARARAASRSMPPPGAPPAAGAPPPAQFESMKTMTAAIPPQARSGQRPGGGGLELDPAVMANADLLAYGDLRMPPPGADRRGTLQLARPAELYMELLASQRIEVSFNVLTVVSLATRRAEAVAHAMLPPRHRVATSDRYDYAYQAETVVDVPSDGAFHSIALTTHSADLAIRHVVVPRESTDVFRVASVANPLGAPILDGPADVYLGKDFLLTTDVAFTPPGGTMKLGLGVEQAVKVARNTSYREESSGLIRGSLLLKHEIRIEIKNHLERAIDCEVRERVPATRKEENDVEVTVERVSPAWAPYEPPLASSPEAGLRGGHAWRVDIEAGGRAALEADYVIKIPAKYELVGGNRREA